jgi:hypothetical protein
MNAPLKKESSVSDDFEVPEHLGEVVEDLKKEQQTIKKEIDDAKAQSTVRKQDESTKVFNIRQHQMELKIAELEDKKQKSEKELQAILQQKNSSLHSDLRKLAQFILNETRKITPQIKDIDTKVSSVVHLRNELQHLFDSNLTDRKKQMQYIEDLITTTHHLSTQVRDTSKLIQTDFHFLTKDLEKLKQERQAEETTLASLKQEIFRLQGVRDDLEGKKAELREIENKLSLAEKNALIVPRLEEEFSLLKKDVQRLKDEKELLSSSNTSLRQEEVQTHEQLSRLKARENELEQAVSSKKDILQKIQEDVLEVRKRLESKKNEEQEIHSRFIQSLDHFNQLQTEIARMEGARVAQDKMLDEITVLFESKKTFFQRELESLRTLSESRSTELDAKLEAKKLKFEEEFKIYTETRKSELKAELDKIDKADRDEIRTKKLELLKEVARIMDTIVSAEGFRTSEEKGQIARKEIEKCFDLVFGRTRRWKFW